MAWFEKIKEGLRRMNRRIAGVGALFLIPLMLITAAEVISRDLLNRPIAGCVELSEYLLSIFILLGLAYAQQTRAHVSVSFLFSKVSAPAQRILHLAGSLISLFLFSILGWQGLVVGLGERTVSDMLRIPQYPFRLLVAVAAFLVCLELLMEVGEVARKLARGL